MFAMQKQAFRHDPEHGVWGDCHRTCIANLLGLPRDDVPHTHEDVPVEDWTALIDAFLAPLGLRELRLHMPATMTEVLAEHGRLNPEVSYILSGKTARGTDHSILCRGGAAIWDPSLEQVSDLVGPMHELGYGVAYITPRRRTIETPADWEPFVRSWRLDTVITAMAG